MLLFASFVILLWHISLVVCQRYAERSPLPVDTLPFDDPFDYDYTQSYYFTENKDIFRWNVMDFPHPVNSHRFCNRVKPSFVCDPDQILKQDEADKLDTFIRQLFKETPCICDDCSKETGGIVIGIALLHYMYQPYNEHPSKIIRNFSETLREKWKLGMCDNDILIVVATTDRLSYTDVGKSTSTYISRDEAYRVFLENKANFTAGRFYEGLHAMLEDYYELTRDLQVPDDDEADMTVILGSLIGSIALFGILLLLVFVVYMHCQRNKRSTVKQIGKIDNQGEGVSSSSTKQHLKVVFISTKTRGKPQSMSKKYQACDTDEKDFPTGKFSIDHEVIDATLASPVPLDDTQLTTVTAGVTSITSEMLDKKLTTAVAGIARTFQPKWQYDGDEIDF